MRGIFRVTRAEFNKIFKRPAVYIMGAVMALVCIISLFTFAPTSRTDNRILLSKDSANANYQLFVGSSGSNNKASFDATILTTDDLISSVEFKTTHDNTAIQFKDKLNDIYKSISSNNNDPTKDYLAELKQLLLDASTFFDYDDDQMDSLEEYYKLLLQCDKVDVDYELSKAIYSGHNYFTTLQDQVLDIYTTIKNINDYETMTSVFDANNFLKTLNNIFDHYIDYIPYTLDCIVDDIKGVETIFKKYYSKLGSSTSAPPSSKDQGKRIVTMLKDKIEEYKKIIDTIVNKDSKIALITTKNKSQLDIVVKRVTDIVDVQILESDTNSKFNEIAEELNNDNYIKQFYSFNDRLIYIDYSSNIFLGKLKSIQKTLATNKEALTEQIESLKNDVSTTRISNSITSYYLMTRSYNSLIEDTITDHITNGLDQSTITKLYSYDLSDFNAYDLNNAITYNNYYLKSNTYSNSYLDSFEYSKNIGYETSAYDYIYSSLKVCSILIILFTMMMAAYLISSEQDSGTIKLLLMRPYKRSKILAAKMLATLFFSLTFLLLAIIISVVGGLATYGLPTLSTVLVSFNSTQIFKTTPIVLLLIYVATIILDIIFFLIIAYFVSIVFKSFAGAISVSFITILLTIVLNIALPNTIAYKFIPFTNISLFRYFGHNSGSATGFISSILATPIQSSMTIWLSLIVCGVFAFILYLITRLIFSKRDY